MSQRPTFAVLCITAAALVAGSAWAQSKPGRTSLAPAGEGPGVGASSPSTSGTSTQSRGRVKQATKRAGRNGALQPAGEAPNPVGPVVNSGAERPRTAARSRGSVKAETKAAASSGSLQPAGEAPGPVGGAPKK